ncbi:MAG: sensor histidine kinase [Sedimentibacter sp.]|uniref:sensor histidine kinase n=1 Tax=Sedimentibacter sp. TaxID=1960295 RepID=UPI002980FC6E|nr:sensor histidine kinase [Sedimentibacter sp.]MDW5299418.1 sensor histidine kinase [Sedimentibacter sp.]
MDKNKKFLYVLKIIIFSILFFTAIYFESAQQQRLYVLTGIFVGFLANNIGKYYIKNQKKLYFMSFILDAALIYAMESYSRLLINYFFHSFYIIVLLEASLMLEQRKGIIVGTVTVLVSMIKYVYLIYYKFNMSNISQMLFFLMLNVLILIIAAFAQHNKQEKERKDILYKELLDAHKKLKEYTDVQKKLSVIEERNRIARDIHDTLGHNMTALIMQLQMAEHYMKTDSSKSEQLLTNSLKTAKDSMSGIREVVETLRGKESALSPDKAIKILVDEFSEKTGAVIDLKITGEVTKNYGANTAIYHILQEALTNAVRHGNATRIWMELNYSNNFIKFNIKDNGSGAEVLNEGFGMKGIRERVKFFNGDVEFASGDGFYINGFLNLNDNFIGNDTCVVLHSEDNND